jgi:2-aminoethylphosphonate-pyruvate transaminase
VNVTPTVRRALSSPDLCHREPEFSRLLAAIRARLVRIFGVRKTHDAALFTGSGTAAVEAMLASGAGRKVLVVTNGVYGDRMREILDAHGVPNAAVAAPPGGFPQLAEIEDALRHDPAIDAVACVHHETSTGMLNPVDAVAALARRLGKRVLVDAVSSLGAERLDLGLIDLCAGSAGKCLHGSPGVAFVLVAKAARPLLRPGGSVYLDLARNLEWQDRGETPFTPAVPLFYAFDAALAELEREGLRRRRARYAAKSALVQEGLGKLGVGLVVGPSRRSHVLTAAWLPAGLSYRRLHDALKRKGFIIYEGQSSLRGRIFRVANLGEVSEGDLRRFLRELGRLVPRRRARRPRVIVLAAGVGRRFGPETERVPKCLLPLGRGQTLLSRYLAAFRKHGLRDVVIVCGHRGEAVRRAARRLGRGLRIRFIENPDYTKGSILSLHRAAGELEGEVLIMDADVYFPDEALGRLLGSPHRSAFLVDTAARSTGEEMMLMGRGARPLSIGKRLDPALEPLGEATGIVRLGPPESRELARIVRELVKKKADSAEYEAGYAVLLGRRPVGIETMDGLFWTEIDFKEDLEKVLRRG